MIWVFLFYSALANSTYDIPAVFLHILPLWRLFLDVISPFCK